MGRSPASKATTSNRKPDTRMTRGLSAMSFNSGYGSDDEKPNLFDDDEIKDVDQNEGEKNDLGQILLDIQKRQAKKSTARTMAFQTQKKALYDSARQTSHSLVQAGLSRLDEIKDNLHELKKQERSLESHLNEFLPTTKAQDEHYTTLIAQYSSMHDHLFPSRVKITDEASGMIRNCPALREEALEHALICAREEVDAARIRRKNAADASDLLKKYKLLLQ